MSPVMTGPGDSPGVAGRQEGRTMARVIVSGAPVSVAGVAQALRDEGAEVVEVVDLDALHSVLAEAGPEEFDAYVQMGASFAVHGDTPIGRVHDFYANGVLARFTALDEVLPRLRPTARVTFVMGALPPEVSSGYDREARRALTDVLGAAARAAVRPAELAVEILEAGTSPQHVAAVTLRAATTHPVRLEPPAEDLDFADWRVEVFGLAMLET
jgi:hypothetical protein